MSVQQIRFFEKNKIDFSNPDAVLSVTDATASDNGQSIVDNVRLPNNDTAWLTTGSNDAANTQLDVDLIDETEIDTIILVLHNFDSYTIQYWNGVSYVDFSTAINESGNTKTTNYHYFNEVSTSRLRLIITATQTVDADKVLRQFIVTRGLLTGQLAGWPLIRRPRIETGKRVSKMLSGRITVAESIAAFSCELSVSNWNIDADLSIVEEIYFGRRAVLMSLSGGDDSQFSHKRVGYRDEDVYLVRAVDDYSPEWASGIYKNGIDLKIQLAEAVK